MTRRSDLIRGEVQTRVTRGLHLGRLHPGERLGSARGAAREAGADYRGVVAALRVLEREGLLEIRPRGGLYVGGAPPSSEASPPFAKGLVGLVLGEIARGATASAVREHLRHCLDATRLRAACIECNTDQLDFLCEELRDGFGLASDPVEISRLRGGLPLEVRRADVLVTTAFHAGDVRRLASRLGKPCILATLDPRQRDEVTRALATGPVYFICTDPRWAEKARIVWAAEPGSERIHTLTLGHDPLGDLPEDAALLVMARARRLLAGSALLERALPHRGFSPETLGRVVAFLVQANEVAARRAPPPSSG